ncbi:hypothetical protein K2173_008822 [Erythroxylum novogranatense]|uniref:Uncharacterized protein n=1 Tax=Erythroxylum novogranatense TaxID=1862640 RepID=A0AAV8U960_9ROSI|nr:hypothetical protein K2173_008822 [Erythroxylum novogranatense]
MFKKPVVCGPPPANIESPLARKKVRKLTESNEQDGQKANLVTRKGRPIKSPNRGPHESAAAKLRNSAQHINEGENKSKEAEVPVIICLEAQVVGNSSCQTPGEKRLKSITNYVELEKIMDRELAVGQSSGKRKRGKPHKLVATNLIEKETVSAPTDGTNEDCQTDCRIKENDLAIAVVSKNVVDDDQPLSMWFGGMHSSTNVGNSVSSARSANGWSDTRDRQADISMEGSVNDGRSNSMPESNLCLPFVKKSTIWKAIEAIEAFQIIPQNPHFEPLAECKEEYREGTAIGYMVTFTSLFEKVSLLQFNDPRNIFESTLESLLGLEKHGFDVAILKDRVSKLLSIKESQGELLNELTIIERQIVGDQQRSKNYLRV